MNDHDIRNLFIGGAQLGPVIEIVSDPFLNVEHAVAVEQQIISGGRRPTPEWWKQYASHSGGIEQTPIGGTMTLHGRVCCYEHMTQMERRLVDLPLPHDTTCPGCQRIFRIRWGVRARR